MTKKDWITLTPGADPHGLSGMSWVDAFGGATNSVGRYYPRYDKYEILGEDGAQVALMPTGDVRKRLVL